LDVFGVNPNFFAGFTYCSGFGIWINRLAPSTWKGDLSTMAVMRHHRAADVQQMPAIFFLKERNQNRSGLWIGVQHPFWIR
jgi:hypothetical protein